MQSGRRVRTLRTHFRLRHQLQGCYLFSHKVKLPDWAFEQQEVTCNKNAIRDNSIWFVETNNNELRAYACLPSIIPADLRMQCLRVQTR